MNWVDILLKNGCIVSLLNAEISNKSLILKGKKMFDSSFAVVFDQVRKQYDVRPLMEVVSENKKNAEAGISDGYLIFGVFDNIEAARQNLSRTPKRISSK